MLSNEDVEEAFPCPIRIEICCCDSYDFINAVQDSFEKLLERHNKNYITKIENIERRFIDIDEGSLDYNEFEIYIGNELVDKGKGPDFFETSSALDEEFYLSLVSVTEGIIKAWHNRIVEIQEENKEKLEQFEQDGYYEMLYVYYLPRIERKAFKYLKKLSARYPNSEYTNMLKRVYRDGLHEWHRKSRKLYRKMSRRHEGRNF